MHVSQAREKEMEYLLAKKDDSLRHSERLRSLYSNTDNETEVRFHFLLALEKL